ncbi:MAG: glycosyltransferase [Lachnospiraceae bacterium]|nr:glycosyltransferase [Lachnospiraceae bacterium]
MYDNPKVTVIMYVKNGAPYFKRSLDSVISQTLQDIEVLIVDGGSTDGTLSVAEEAAEKDERVRILCCGKGSVGAQFNLGLREARGEYIGIVESDDYILPGMYEIEYQYAKGKGCDVLRADNYIFFGLDRQEVRIRTKVSHDDSTYGREWKAGRDDDRIQIGGSYWTGLYRRKYLLEKEIWMNESKGAAYQDFGFLFLTSALAESLYFLDDAFYCYRKDNPGSSCNRPQDVFMVHKEYDFLKRELVNRGLWGRLGKYYYLWKIRNERWFFYNLNQTDQKRFLPYFYEDMKNVSPELSALDIKWNMKEKKILDLAAQSEESFGGYLGWYGQRWEDTCKRIQGLSKEDAVYIFGAGNIGRMMCRYLQSREVEPKAYVDNNAGLWGTEIEQISVLPPDEIRPGKGNLFLICSENYADEIEADLRGRGIPDGQMAVVDDMDACIHFMMG